MVQAFQGNRAESKTMLPVLQSFMAAHQLPDVTVVADAGMFSEANQNALAAAGLSFVLGTRIPHRPGVVCEWRDKHPDDAIPDGLVPTQPWPSTSAERAHGIPDRVIHYQYGHDRARRTLRGIDEQIAKAQRAVDGHPLVGQPATFVIDAYHQLWHIEKAFRMSRHDLQARPIYHRLRESIGAHLSIMVAAMAVRPLHREPNRLEHREIRSYRTPLPHRQDQSRPTNPDRSRPAT
jgi:hypothetical protein